MHEDRGARRSAGRLKKVTHECEAVAHKLRTRWKVAEDELVALLGDLRGGGDIDHEWHATLLRNLSNRGGGPRVERPYQNLRAVVDELLRARARRVNVRLGIGMQELDRRLVTDVGKHGGRYIRPKLARLADGRLEA